MKPPGAVRSASGASVGGMGRVVGMRLQRWWSRSEGALMMRWSREGPEGSRDDVSSLPLGARRRRRTMIQAGLAVWAMR